MSRSPDIHSSDCTGAPPGAERSREEMTMKYFEKQKGNETLILAEDASGNYSIASNIDPDPDGFVGPPDPFARGFKQVSRVRATEVLGYDPEER
jgi:hypothetical protein